jgi:hypothetical protein
MLDEAASTGISSEIISEKRREPKLTDEISLE